ncbi:hypothetical protein [Microbulbifer hydrolyticus]|nr:hypothetical protein [Microbulbifer hydrolyticus]MBB5211505.1 hypothetical protein [Microbulbifer hydrolyticus]
MRLLSIIFVFLFSTSVYSDEIPCWMNPDTVPETTQLAVLKTYLLPINLDSPGKDLEARVKHQDYRFITIGGFGIGYPGLSNKEFLCKYGSRYIMGTSDALESKEHSRLTHEFSRYAKEYNMALERKLSAQ